MSEQAAGVLPSGQVAVVVPAAGQGARLGGARKQDRLLGDAPLLVQTLRRFDTHPGIDHLVVAAPYGEAEAYRAQLQRAGFHTPLTVTEGGQSRRASVQEALAVLPESVTWVLVHDAVRPFVSHSLISTVLETARRQGAAVPAIPVSDTVRRAEAGVFGETVPRDGLYRVQTPQGFRRDWLVAAHALAAPDAQVTDDAALVQQTGNSVYLVEGMERNIKITTPDDWALACLLWKYGLE